MQWIAFDNLYCGYSKFSVLAEVNEYLWKIWN